MKLKTLKDIKTKHEGYEFKYMVSTRRLKQEAIKWVKDSILYRRDCTNSYNDITKKATSMWIRFFNITEEDLK